MNIILSHPSTAPFVQNVAKNLDQNSMLEFYSTTIGFTRQDLLIKFSKFIDRILGTEIESELNRRLIDSIPKELVHTFLFPEIIRVVVAKLDREGVYADRVWEWSEKYFDKHSASLINNNTQAVYGFEHASYKLFYRAKQLGLKCIYDLPATEHDYTQRLIFSELEKFPELNSKYHKHIKTKEKERTDRRINEFKLADLVIVNSNFTKNSYHSSNYDQDKIKVVPYGAPKVHARANTYQKNNDKLKVLWVGTFSIRKGAHYALSAWRKLNIDAELYVFGAQELPDRLLQGLPDNIKFSGTVPKEKLSEYYLKSDVLLFPSLCDGFGMVVTEAFAHGLPVITTRNVGACDLVVPYSNGLIIDAFSDMEIMKALNWCIENRSLLYDMRAKAIATAKSWQWEDYGKLLIETISNFNESK
jgi:glycosyltransferase involved in cell wall biosynthesis